MGVQGLVRVVVLFAVAELFGETGQGLVARGGEVGGGLARGGGDDCWPGALGRCQAGG